MQVSFSVLNEQSCSEWYINSNLQICAGTQGLNTTVPKDTCSGDSGGPLMSQDSTGLWNIVGITSFGSFILISLRFNINCKP